MGIAEYQKVAGNEDLVDNFDDKREPISRAPWKKHSMLVGVAIGSVVVALLTALFLRTHPTPSSSTTEPTATQAPAVVTETSISYETSTVFVTSTAIAFPTGVAEVSHENDLVEDCGGSPEQARAKGCVYDVMMQLWMPARCYDGPLTERYLAGGNWTWWADPGAEHEIPDDIIRLGEHKVTYVSQEYHKTHCIFAWEKLVRALNNDEPIIEQLISYDHLIHCRHNALNEALKVQGAIAPTGFTKCAKYSTWQNMLPHSAHSTTEK